MQPSSASTISGPDHGHAPPSGAPGNMAGVQPDQATSVVDDHVQESRDAEKASQKEHAGRKSTTSLLSANTVANKITNIKSGFKKPSFWVVSFGTLLAACAGMVNVTAFLNLNAFVSHVTGTVSRLGMRLEGSDPGEWWVALLLVVCFMVGAFLCGLIVKGNEVHTQVDKVYYGVVLLGNSILLVAVTFLADHEFAKYLAAAACGMQNGMCTMHFGAVVRTTHVTGLVTDLGLSLGRIAAVFCKKRCVRSRLNVLDRTSLDVEAKKTRTLATLGLGFLGGVTLGAFFHRWMGVQAFLIPAAITGTAGILCTFFRKCVKASVRSLEAGIFTKTISKDVTEMQQILERTRAQMESMDAADREQASEVFADQTGRMLVTMRTIESCITELCSQPGKKGSDAVVNVTAIV